MSNLPHEVEQFGEFPENIPVDFRAARKQFSRLGMGGFIILVISSILKMAMAGLLIPLFSDGAVPSWLLWVYSFVPLYLVAIPIGLLIMRQAPAAPLEKHSLKTGQIISIACICYFMVYAGNIVGMVILSLLQKVLGIASSNPLDSYIMSESEWLKILVMAILAPMIEEYIFRKQLIDRMHIYGEKLAVFTSALLFGLFHGNLSQLFYAFTLGLVFGYVYLKTGKLRYSVGLHMLINFSSVMVSFLMNDIDLPSLDSWDTSNPMALALRFFELLILLLYLMCAMMAFVAGLVLLCVKGQNIRFYTAKLELPKGRRFKTVFLNVGMILLIAACLLSIVLTFIA